MTQATFVQIPIDLISYARTLKLSGTQYDLWLYLWSKDPFGDRFVEIPSPDALAAELGVNPRTIQRAAQRLQDADLFDFQIEAWKCRNTTQSTPIKTPDKKLRVRTKRSHPGQKDLISDKKIPSRTKRSHLGQKDPNIELQPLPESASSSLQTLQTLQKIQTNQTRGGEKTFWEKTDISTRSQEQENQLEQEIQQAEGLPEKNGLETIASGVETIKRPVVQNTTQESQTPSIPQDLIDKLEELEIPLDERVKGALASHHLSQAYGAIAHIENTWETINNPRGVFLFQLPRQPVEPNGRGRVRTARDLGGYTLAHLKKMYPQTWREAAAHFGIDIPAGEGES